MGYSPRGCKESDMTERLHFQFLQDRAPPACSPEGTLSLSQERFPKHPTYSSGCVM